MNRNRFRLALEQLRPAQWERFEELASAFLIDEYPGLRTTASPSGDGGRDARLWSPTGDEDVVIQYSVQHDWSAKITQTVASMEKNFPDARSLVYVTNQVVGAAADEQVQRIRKKHEIYLDIRDQYWFLERMDSSRARESAAEALAIEIVDPFLARAGVIEHKAQALTSSEARAACVYLALQWEDDTREKGLTRVCFEALVRSALRDTDPENRLPRDAIRERVRQLVPAHPAALADRYTDSALSQLTKRVLRWYRKEDEFCLTHDERVRIRDRLADLEIGDNALRVALRQLVVEACSEVRFQLPVDADQLAHSTRLVIDQVLWRRGEVFASAVQNGTEDVEYPDLVDVARSVARRIGPNPATVDNRIHQVLVASAKLALAEPSPEVQAYLRGFADAYTLFAFMRETPDVQAAVVKMFATGEVWLDTTVVLPLFAEELADDSARRLFSTLLGAAAQSGLKILITPGVLEELDSHMRRCLAYTRQTAGQWEGRVPFLSAAFALTGRARGEMPTWLERFRGGARPQDDIAEYLRENYGIQVSSLEADAHGASVELRGAVQEVWQEAHERRRGQGFYAGDANTTARLVDHDVENYLGVVRRRRRERDSPFGYTTWWLTLDRTAYRVRTRISEHLPPSDVPDSPVLSPDFLVNYLAIGPVRNRIERAVEAALPLSISDLPPLDLLPTELLDAAEEVRVKMNGMPEHMIRREVRDTLDRGRRRIGPLAEGGLEHLMQELRGAVSTEQ